MKQIAAFIFAVMLASSCSRESDQPRSIALNAIESVSSQQIIHEGQPWVEVTLSQRLDPKAPAYVIGIRDDKWTNRLRWALVMQTISADRVTSRFRFRPVIGTNEIILTRDDFEWFPPISGFETVRIALRKAEPSGPADGSQPSSTDTDRTSAAAGSRR